MAQALIALGSNLGDRAAMLDRAVAALGRIAGVKVLRASSWHETDAVGGPPNQGRYLNGAVLIETTLEPFALHAQLQRIEAEMGRVRGERWGPRTIDLDLLLYDSWRIETPALVIPHPRMIERRFVLAPAAELAAGMRHPVNNLTIKEMLSRLDDHPRVVATVDELRSYAFAARRDGRRIALVPTMGALHAGHLSLIDAAARECSLVIVTIFVNPTQFGPHEDFERYPRMLEKDLSLLAGRNVELVFAPSREEMYRPGHATTVNVTSVSERWEGAIRPGHFEGVATIVLKLFEAAVPDIAYFGQKDYQQLVVIRRMTMDLDLPIEIRMWPIVRDSDGMALSSRNAYLSADERRRGLSLWQSLQKAIEMFRAGERAAERIEASIRTVLDAAPVEVDYAAIVEPDTLAPTAEVRSGSVALVAARVGGTRLIDNHVFDWGLDPGNWDEGGEA